MTPQQEALKAVPSQNGHRVEEFDERQEPIHVRVGGVDYYVHELDDAGLGTWMKLVGRRVVRNDKGKVVKEDYKGFHTDLIALCLRDAAGVPVPKDAVRPWGANVKARLFEMCQKINGMTRAEEEESEKNSDEADTTGGSAE